MRRSVHIRGGGAFLDKLPVELHIPGYNYCGPGTKLAKRLARGDKGINLLDEACKEHDIAYTASKDQSTRHIADRILAHKAAAIRARRDIGIGQRIAALAVDKTMRAKVKLGMGAAIKKKIKKKKKVKSRVLHPPTTKGGIIPFLIPVLAGLSALGSLAGGASAIARTVKNAQEAREQLKESQRHNKMMETVAIGKGLYLKPYKKGLGLYMNKKKRVMIAILPDRPLTNTDLIKIITKKLKIPRFRGVFMRDTLPKTMWKTRECGIINLDSEGGFGTHWVAYVKNSVNTIYYFDSFGDLQPPDEVRQYFTDRRSIFYNCHRYQDFNTYVCGHLCIMFIITFMKIAI